MASCSDPDAAMKIEKSPTDFTILMGSIQNATSKTDATIFATDGELTCEGKALSNDYDIGWVKNKTKTNFDLKCSNGAEGKLMFQGTDTGMDDLSGAGVGSLSDGSKVKLIVGDMSATIGW